MRRSSLSLLWLLIVFVSGTSVGMLGHRYFARQPQPEERPARSRDEVRREFLSRLKERVGVTDEQMTQIVALLDKARADSDARKAEFDQDMRSIQHHTREQMRALMTPEQVAKYDAWREERKREREKHDRERGRGGPPNSR